MRDADPFAALPMEPWQPPAHLRLWWALRGAWFRVLGATVCRVRGHRGKWHGGVVDWEAGETEGERYCTRCGEVDRVC